MSSEENLSGWVIMPKQSVIEKILELIQSQIDLLDDEFDDLFTWNRDLKIDKMEKLGELSNMIQRLSANDSQNDNNKSANFPKEKVIKALSDSMEDEDLNDGYTLTFFGFKPPRSIQTLEQCLALLGENDNENSSPSFRGSLQ
jgi:hypothetical protein